MIFEALFLAFTLGSENAKKNTATVEVRRMLNDEETMRTEFFAKSRKWQEDMFTLFGTEQLASGKDFQWQEALEKLDLLEEGYFPYSMFLKYPLSEEELKKYHMFGFEYKTVPIASGDYADLYLKLSDVEKYIVHRNSSGNYYMPSKYEQMPQEIRNLFYDGKVTIGVPFGQDGYIPSQVMTIPEAREFMSCKMEERFQKYYEKMRK